MKLKKYKKEHVYSRKQRTGGVTTDESGEISADYQVKENKNKFSNEYSDKVTT